MSGGDDWRIGDLALRVSPASGNAAWKPAVGGVYTVADCGVGDAWWLDLEEDPNVSLNSAWLAENFRKISPLTPEEHRRAIIELAADQPAPIEA